MATVTRNWTVELDTGGGSWKVEPWNRKLGLEVGTANWNWETQLALTMELGQRRMGNWETVPCKLELRTIEALDAATDAWIGNWDWNFELRSIGNWTPGIGIRNRDWSLETETGKWRLEKRTGIRNLEMGLAMATEVESGRWSWKLELEMVTWDALEIG